MKESVDAQRLLVHGGDVVLAHAGPALIVAIRDELDCQIEVVKVRANPVLVEPIGGPFWVDRGVPRVLWLPAELADPWINLLRAGVARASVNLEPVRCLHHPRGRLRRGSGA